MLLIKPKIELKNKHHIFKEETFQPEMVCIIRDVLYSLLTFVMHSKARRNVNSATAKVNILRCFLRRLKSSANPVITASMPPICKKKEKIKQKNDMEVKFFNTI